MKNNSYLELNLGCGFYEKKRYFYKKNVEFKNVIKLDVNPECNPDIVWDLNKHPLPFDDAIFNEIHAYHILEHLGSQGDYKFFFSEFNEYYRILKKNGELFGIVPSIKSNWAIGDPGHTRVFHPYWLSFLDASKYDELGETSMSDYRNLIKCNYKIIDIKNNDDSFCFILRAIK